MLVWTICRRVCPLKVAPLLCGDAPQVPVQAGATAAFEELVDSLGEGAIAHAAEVKRNRRDRRALEIIAFGQRTVHARRYTSLRRAIEAAGVARCAAPGRVSPHLATHGASRRTALLRSRIKARNESESGRGTARSRQSRENRHILYSERCSGIVDEVKRRAGEPDRLRKNKRRYFTLFSDECAAARP
jgi:hypothetical protein